MAKQRFEFREGKSAKFWQISVTGDSYLIEWGRIGTTGQSKTKAFPDAKTARAAAEKLIAQKTAKGYQAVGKAKEVTAKKSAAKKTTAKKATAKKATAKKSAAKKTTAKKATTKKATTKKATAKKAPAKKITPKKATKRRSTVSEASIAAFESAHELEIPERYRSFLLTELKDLKKRYIGGLPRYQPSVRFPVSFVGLNLDLFEANNVSDETREGWLPLAQLEDEAQFLAVNIAKKKCPVAMWEHEIDEFLPLAPTFDLFLTLLGGRKDKTPDEIFYDLRQRVGDLIQKEAYQTALDLLEAATIPEIGDEDTLRALDMNLAMQAFHNDRGICLSELDRIEAAADAFRVAVELESSAAWVNLVRLELVDKGNVDGAIAALESLEQCEQGSDTQPQVLCLEGVLALLRGDKKQAMEKFRTLKKKYGAYKDKMEAVSDVFEKIAERFDQVRSAADEVSPLLRPNTYQLAKKELAKIRSWWNTLPEWGEFWQPLFLEAVDLPPTHEPDDEDLGRIIHLTHLDIPNEHSLSRVDMLKPLRCVEWLGLCGEVENPEAIAHFKKTLRKLYYNSELIEALELPRGRSAADKALFEACDKQDFEQIKATLAQGANINARVGVMQETPLHRYTSEASLMFMTDPNPDYTILDYLIEHGADIYAEDLGKTMPLSEMEPHVEKRMIDRYKRRKK